MFPSPLPALQILAPLPEPRLTAADLSDWSPGVAEALRGLGFLVGLGLVREAVCSSCGGVHRFERLPHRPALLAAACPDAGLVVRSAEQLQDWTIDHAQFATWIGHQMQAKGEPEELLPGQAWRWNTVQFAWSRRALIILRSVTARTPPDTWRRLNLVPKAMILSFGTKPMVPEVHGPVAFTAPVWSYLEDDGGLRLLAGDLAEDVLAAEQAHEEPERPVADKRGTRLRIIRMLHQELAQHIQSAKDAVRQKMPVPPRPEQQWLAKAVGSSKATVCRCLTEDDSRDGLALRRLWEIAGDPDAITTFNANTTQ